MATKTTQQTGLLQKYFTGAGSMRPAQAPVAQAPVPTLAPTPAPAPVKRSLARRPQAAFDMRCTARQATECSMRRRTFTVPLAAVTLQQRSRVKIWQAEISLYVEMNWSSMLSLDGTALVAGTWHKLWRARSTDIPS